MASGPDAQREILGLVRQALRQSKLAAVDSAGLTSLLSMCDELDRARSRRKGAFDRFERDEFLAASEEVRGRVYALATALGRALPDQRGLAEHLFASEVQAPKSG